MTDPRYPIGEFTWPGSISASERTELIRTIAATPPRLRMVVEGLHEEQLNTPYREGGWTARQVVHHLSDSHLNAYARFKLTLTEDEPIFKTYDEKAWAETPEVHTMPVEISLALLDNLHDRWVSLLLAMRESDFARTFRNPIYDGPRTLDWYLALLAWHGPHHVAQIRGLRERMGW